MATEEEIRRFKAAFKVQAELTNKGIRWEEATAFWQTQTSLAGIAGKLDTAASDPSVENLRAVQNEINALPEDSTTRYQVALDDLKANLSNAFRAEYQLQAAPLSARCAEAKKVSAVEGTLSGAHGAMTGTENAAKPTTAGSYDAALAALPAFGLAITAVETAIKKHIADTLVPIDQNIETGTAWHNPVPNSDAKSYLDTVGGPLKLERAALDNLPSDADKYVALAPLATKAKNYLDLAPKVYNFADKREAANKRIEFLKASPGLLEGCGPQIGRLDALLNTADSEAQGRRYEAARSTVVDLLAAITIARQSGEAFWTYTPDRSEASKAIEALKSHPQSTAIASEIAGVEAIVTEADRQGTDVNGGWGKATILVKTVPGRCATILELADQLVDTQDRVAELKEAFEQEGLTGTELDELTDYAHKLVAAEGYNTTDAIAAAKAAKAYKTAGLSEEDSVMSARVEMTLLDEGVDAPLAREVGKSIRRTGTADAEDAKAVAMKLKNLPIKMIRNLTANGITTTACRGPATDCLSHLCGEHPRGWPEDDTWDKVPGCYSPSNKHVVVGTMDDGGSRKVPGPSEGPLTHGSFDLVGHEAGHAFDVTDGGVKNRNQQFLEARSRDLPDPSTPSVAATEHGFEAPRDNYFLTSSEGGTNSAGATSETFAESCAYHAGGKTDWWPNLKSFWQANPWDV